MSYIPSQTPESEEVTTDYESSSLETPSESEYSIACSEDCSGSSDRSSSYFSVTDTESSTFDSVSDSQTSIMTVSVSSESDAESSTLSESDSQSSLSD